MAEPKPALAPDDVAFFQENGYLAIDALVSPDEVATLRTVYDRLFEARAGREAGDQFDLAGDDADPGAARLPQILSPSKYAPELAAAAFRERALAYAKQLLGREAVPQGEHAILKPAYHGAPTPWHQDESYWGEDLDYHALSVWVPLQDATVENGCMQFIPKSHRFEVLPHHPIGHDPRVHGLEVDVIDDTAAVACPIPAGGATFHASRTLHYAGPNHTPAPRRAYILLFGVPPVKRATPRDFYWNKQKTTARQARAEAWTRDHGKDAAK